MLRQSFGKDQRVSFRDKIFLCRDRVGQARSFIAVTKCFYVVTEFAMVERLYVAIEYFMSRLSVAKWRGFVLRHSNSMS